jgi:hypothetical protein
MNMMQVLKGRTCLLLPGKWYHEWEMLGLALTSRIAIACSFTLLQVTSSELLPLEYRDIGIFSSVTFARICLLNAPFILLLVSLHVMVYFCVFCVV